MGKAIARWMGFGVVLSALPFLLAIGFYKIVGLEVERTEYIPDLLLVTFAIAVNALSSATDGFKNKVLSTIFSILSLISMIICSCGYFFLFGGILIVNKIIIDFKYLEAIILPLLDNFNWDWIIYAAIVLLLLNAIMGLISEGGKGLDQPANSIPPNSPPPNSPPPNSPPPNSPPPNSPPPNSPPPNNPPPNNPPPNGPSPNSTSQKSNSKKAKSNSRAGRSGRRHK